jgi:hypothetical protein
MEEDKITRRCGIPSCLQQNSDKVKGLQWWNHLGALDMALGWEGEFGCEWEVRKRVEVNT